MERAWWAYVMTLAALGTIAACDDLGPGAGSSPGTGTGTLDVVGTAYAVARHANAKTRDAFDTTFVVEIGFNGQPVRKADVTVISESGSTSLTVDKYDRWTGSAPSYDPVYVLDVYAGRDMILNVRVEGPEIHVFSQPAEHQVVDPALPLELAWQPWTRGAALFYAEHLVGSTPDTGSMTLPQGAFLPGTAEPRPATVRLARRTGIAPAGARPHPKGSPSVSGWGVSVENTLDVVVQAQPAASAR